jgi:Uma2 family endonuclease
MHVTAKPEVIYPSSDGQRMAENTRQYEWIVTIKGNLDIICTGERAAFVAGDNLIYPVEGDNTIRMAPDVYVAFGRPRGHRGSYQVWLEENIFPQVIFEILSPSNTRREMELKRDFYRTYGVEEFYIYDPDRVTLEGWQRTKRRFNQVAEMHGHISPRLGIRFDMAGLDLEITGPDGKPFLSFAELHERAEVEHKRAEQERKRADAAESRITSQDREIQLLREKLRKLGINPEKP